MAKYRKKPIVIEATQWFKGGDHEAVLPWWKSPVPGTRDAERAHDQCDLPFSAHGRIETLESVPGTFQCVCPGDWIITGIANEHYPCKDAVFQATYESMGP